ncbi:MAG: UDP-4-amino-4,6-dideoxy-L-N-acetyl-beta-L-altrosamine transaminase [Chlamydiales bacterium]|jgi:UDP-4-amino-4,6-dideoxy-L-N-acetyl-beta-L-altrosamine transaminase
MDDFTPYAKQSIDQADIEEVCKVLSSQFITRGPKVAEFENAIAEYCGSKHAVAFNSGSTALQAAYYAAEASSFDTCITTPNTFVATVSAGMAYGSSFVFADIDRNTGNFDIDQVIECMSHSRSRGRDIIIPVHYAGVPVDIRHLEKAVKNPSTLIIEDAAHALGSTYRDGQKVGSCIWSDMTVFSFHPAKTITTGEGGMVTTNDDYYFKRLQSFRNNGISKDFPDGFESPGPWYYEVNDLTSNYNFTEFQAALGLSQFKKLDQFIQSRRHLIQRYRKQLARVPNVKMTPSDFDSQTAFHLCSVQIDFEACKISRSELMHELEKKGIGTQVHYIPVYRHPYFVKMMGDLEEHFPQMEEFYSQELSLPLFPDLEERELDRICQILASLLKKQKVARR